MLNRISAKLSAAVYKNSNAKLINAGYDNLEGWEFLESTIIRGQNGYYGAAFKGNNTIIIAHRGTELNFDDLKNDLSLLWGKPLNQIPHALNFSAAIINKYHNVSNIQHTGHSLGGLIAEVMGLNYNQPVISFEAPGALKTAQYVIKNSTKIEQSNLITSYLASPNIINTFGQHVAKVIYKINYFTKPLGESFFKYLLYSLEQHSIVKLAQEFDPITDKPNDYEVIKVEDWPSGFEAGYLSFINNEELWEQKAKIDWDKNIILESGLDPDTLEITEVKLRDEYKSLEAYQEKINQERKFSADDMKSNELLNGLKLIKHYGLWHNSLFGSFIESSINNLRDTFFDIEHTKICQEIGEDSVCALENQFKKFYKELDLNTILEHL